MKHRKESSRGHAQEEVWKRGNVEVVKARVFEGKREVTCSGFPLIFMRVKGCE